jgi:hypothetical protein
MGEGDGALLVSLRFSVDLRAFQRMRREYTSAIPRIRQDAVQTAVRMGAEHARTKHQHTRRSGTLTSRATLFGRIVRNTARTTVGEIANTTFYVRWVEFGRGPVHAIRAKALRFRLDGVVVFRQSVGPARPRPFMRQAGNFARFVLRDQLNRKLNQLSAIWF